MCSSDLPVLIPETGCGQSRQKSFLLLMSRLVCKKSKKMYKRIITGNTIIRKEIRQHKIIHKRQHFSTYLIHTKKNFWFIDTRFFTVSFFNMCIIMYSAHSFFFSDILCYLRH